MVIKRRSKDAAGRDCFAPGDGVTPLWNVRSLGLGLRDKTGSMPCPAFRCTMWDAGNTG